MVFELELEDDDSHNSGSVGGHLLDSLSPVQRAWLLGAGGVPADGHKTPQEGPGTTIREITNSSLRQDGEMPGSLEDAGRHEVTQNAQEEEGNKTSVTMDEDDEAVTGVNMNNFSLCLYCYP
jgi:hypothetical protein